LPPRSWYSYAGFGKVVGDFHTTRTSYHPKLRLSVLNSIDFY
jgi:hypothetical protein